jgi:hypothetical protein
MFKKRISSGLTILAILGLALGAIGCAQQNVVQATATPIPATATTAPTATSKPTATSLPTATPQPTATLPPTATSLPTLLPPTAGQIQALDMAAIESDLVVGFGKGFITGNYAYFVPHNYCYVDPAETQCPAFISKVVRVELNNFTPGGATVLDLKSDATGGIWTSFTDGRYGYFTELDGLSNNVFRVDLQNFSSSGITILSLDEANPNLSYTGGEFTDGHYAYFHSNTNVNGTNNGLLSRVDLQNFNPKSVVFLDSNPYNGCTDGKYGYFTTNIQGGPDASPITRVDLQDFTPNGVTQINLSGGGHSAALNGQFCNQGYLYVAPDANGKIIRLDTSNFTTSGITTLDLSTLDQSLHGYVSAFTDGHYGYFLPNYASPDGDYIQGSGTVARVDLSNFTAGGVTWLDLTRLDKGWNNFMDGMADSHYIYLEPGDYSPSVTSLNMNTSVVRISLDYAGWTALP